MKRSKFAVAVATVAMSSASMAADVLSEGFDNFAALAAAGWVQVNASPSANQPWGQGNTGVFPAAAGPADSYAATSFLAGSPSISSWLMTPTLTLSGAGSLSFQVRTAGEGFLDTVETYLSSNGASTNTADFTTLLGTFSASTDLGWLAQTYAVPLDGSGRIGFRYLVGDVETQGNYLGIDSVSVVPEPSPFALAGVALLAAAVHRCRAAGARARARAGT